VGAEDYKVAAASLTDQIRRLRNHPSLLVWLNGSDNPPPADVEKMYKDILQRSVGLILIFLQRRRSPRN
jgi:exo-1,4-beta-D-glucosaminidase